ncbi:sulfatase family protein [Dysgonomonas termitidis]|uniref:Sulfatase n=1 Tax=Dysgonomonas termitidis TaxID=1516126 RepID=A0ABV9L091_9BACT
MMHQITKITFACCGLVSFQAYAQKAPNIILILADDMGYGDLTVTGATQYHTPAIDRLAGEGMTFTQFYSAQPISSASRAGLLTGCYPNRVGISGALYPQSKIGLNKDEETIAEILKKKGYMCGMVGKWHLGSMQPFLPLQNGFDDYLGLPYSNDMWPVDYEGNRVTPDSGLAHKLRHPALPLIDGNEKVKEIWTLEDQGQLTTLYTQRAIQFIRKCKHEETPFFLYFAHSMPHVPLAVSGKFKGKSRQGLYGDAMMEIDWSLQEIMNTLKEYQLDENTLIIFTSDNGPWANFGNHAGSTGGLREAKATTFEGGQRVPCIMRWKGVIPEGKICNELTSAIDILPTLAEITKAASPSNKIDGVSILPLLTGNMDESPRKYFLYYYGGNDLEAIRDSRFKLIFPHEHESYRTNLPGNDGFPGIRGRSRISVSLFDMRRDPGEQYNVADLYPDAVKRLSAVADSARTDLGDNLTKREGENRRPHGSIE